MTDPLALMDMSPGPGPRLRLRPGAAGDGAAMLAIKERLKMRPDPGAAPSAPASSRGGFLLGSTRAQYEALIEGAQVDVLVDGGEVVGFVTALPDAALRRSDVWARREQIALGGDLGPSGLAAIEGLALGYVDQLALLPDLKYRLCAPALAWRALTRLFDQGAALVFTTVVAAPVRNLVTRPLLAAVGAIRLGAIEEHYPGAGAITSDVFCITRAALGPSAGDERRRARLAALERWTARLLG